MRKPGTDPNNVQMSEVLCDFCHREWSPDEPMIEGHQGSCLCGRCLTVAYTEVILHGNTTAPPQYKCPMCLEESGDRESLDRAGEGGWQSPVGESAVICKRCIELAAQSLGKNSEWEWTVPQGSAS